MQYHHRDTEDTEDTEEYGGRWVTVLKGAIRPRSGLVEVGPDGRWTVKSGAPVADDLDADGAGTRAGDIEIDEVDAPVFA